MSGTLDQLVLEMNVQAAGKVIMVDRETSIPPSRARALTAA